jgi:heat shock protein HslJ
MRKNPHIHLRILVPILCAATGAFRALAQSPSSGDPPLTFALGGQGSATAQIALENTHWRLSRLGDADVSPDAQQTEAYLVLDPKDHRVSGSSGCNRLIGSYELNEDKLRFGRIASTMMACTKGMETELAFIQALEQVNSWKITGLTLELFDISGKRLARFDTQSSP